MRGIGKDETSSGDMAARQRYLTEAARRARQEAGRARRLADTQTGTEVIEDLRDYAEGLERNAVLFEQQAAEFARKLATTRRLAGEIQEQADTALARLQEMADRLTKQE